MARQIDHKTMRLIVGLIAILLAPTVIWLSNTDTDLTSISISYWTDSHDIFVGSLIAVGFFLSAYNGSGDGKDLEFYLSKISCVFAICVALFPTTGFSESDIPPEWVLLLAEAVNIQSYHIHYGAAVLLFVYLIAMMWFFSNRAMKKGKSNRALMYRAISVLMVAGIIIIFVVGNHFKFDYTVLFIEAWGLTLFGIGWLIAGLYKTENSI